jgi:molybdate transport system permease protein
VVTTDLAVRRRPRRGRRARRPPWFLLLPGLVALAFLVVPMVGLVAQVPWDSFLETITAPEAMTALRLSLVTSTLATCFAAVVGVPFAWLLARDVLPFTHVWRALVLVPLLLPPVVSGVALLAAFGRFGLVGQYVYSWFGFQIPFTTLAVVLAMAFVAMPFLIITLEGAFRTLDRRYEDAAATLGASSWATFRRVTLPLAGPSLLAGAVLCWARALGEFGATVTFAGSFPGTTQTMPIAIYYALDTNWSAAISLSVVLMGVCIAVLVALRGRYLRTSS